MGRSKPKRLRTRYQQELRYLQRRNWHLKTNPRKMFEDNLIQMLKKWKSQGDRLLLGLDMNDNILKGLLANRLFKEVEICELTHQYWVGEEQHTYLG